MADAIFHLYRWTKWRWVLKLDTWRVQRNLTYDGLYPLWGSPDWRKQIGRKV